MQKYNFNRIKGWTEEQIKNGEYHEFNRTRIYTDTRNKKRRVPSTKIPSEIKEKVEALRASQAQSN